MNAFEPVDLAIVGGGISGLTCAFWAKKLGRSVALFESSADVGGCITTVRSGPYIADGGPQSFVGTQIFMRLVSDAGLEGLLLPASPSAAKAYLYSHGCLVAAPQSPQEMVLTPLLSPLAKLRALAEPLVGQTSAKDESVADFVRRRAGPAVLDAFVAPYVSGLFAGDPARLSVRSAFPVMAGLETQYGSVLRGALAARKQDRAGSRRHQENMGSRISSRPNVARRSYGFRGGNDMLPRTLAAHLGTDLRLHAPVKAIWQRGAWMELLVAGSPDSRVVAKSVVLATPSSAAADLLEPLEPKAADALRAIEYPTVVQIAMAYPLAAIGPTLDGFGFLVPRSQGLKILGCVWNSAMFPDRCPHEEVLVTAFLGGALDQSVTTQSDDELARVAHQDVQKVLMIKDAAPQVIAGFRWQEAIPQYNVGHAERLNVVQQCLKRLPQLKLCGSYLKGPSVPDCIVSAQAVLG